MSPAQPIILLVQSQGLYLAGLLERMQWIKKADVRG